MLPLTRTYQSLKVQRFDSIEISLVPCSTYLSYSSSVRLHDALREFSRVPRVRLKCIKTIIAKFHDHG